MMPDEESQSHTSSTLAEKSLDGSQDAAERTYGYCRLAAMMGESPELCIFRRFATLNNLNLLYLQAELVEIEDCLRDLAAEDEYSSEQYRRNLDKNWLELSRPNLDGEEACHRQRWKVALRMREVLKEYSMLHIALDFSPSTNSGGQMTPSLHKTRYPS